MGIGHYENFPVASLLLPPRLRPAVRAIYRFARTADDIADEGERSDAERIGELAAMARELDAIAAGGPNSWPDLAAAIRDHTLPMQPFHDLLSAFSQDVTVRSYASFAELDDYCRRSANPIGRLLLSLYRRTDPASCAQSDAICSALQLTNFWQDVALDHAKGRIYIPRSELQRHGLGPHDIAARHTDTRWRALMRSLTEHARAMLWTGAPLARTVGSRIGFELRLVIQGGLRILERIDTVGGDVFTRRPVLGLPDWLVIGARALRM
ncbi:MAG: squalene synthase HpnC [Gemmatimonadota bacterium]